MSWTDLRSKCFDDNLVRGEKGEHHVESCSPEGRVERSGGRVRRDVAPLHDSASLLSELEDGRVCWKHIVSMKRQSLFLAVSHHRPAVPHP